MEFGIRGEMLRMGAVILQKLLARTDGGYRGSSVPCSCGEKARFVGRRAKRLSTLLGEIEIRRAYYHCAKCGEGRVTQDRLWDVEGCGYSPGLRRLASRVGSGESFASAGEDLRELAGIEVSPKEVERISEEVGEEILEVEEGTRERVFSENVIALPSTRKVEKVYIEVDGTGVPVVPSQTVGRKGKGADGKARTREAKLGCVFSQTGVDEKGRPVRDEATTTYVGGIETAEEVGRDLYAEVDRRGFSKARKQVVLGDGAVWIWELADEHFPEAVQIVDLYHAREHLWSLGHTLYEEDEKKRKRWVGRRIKELDRGDVSRLLKAFDGVQVPNQKAGEVLRKKREYFNKNRDRMRYGRFKAEKLFLGSGVIEAGCKSVIGHRLKQSGMRWSVRGANAVIALRRCRASGGWEDFWAERATQRGVA
jgi:hypothetical protein